MALPARATQEEDQVGRFVSKGSAVARMRDTSFATQWPSRRHLRCPQANDTPELQVPPPTPNPVDTPWREGRIALLHYIVLDVLRRALEMRESGTTYKG